jgi:hypothetical protein
LFLIETIIQVKKILFANKKNYLDIENFQNNYTFKFNDNAIKKSSFRTNIVWAYKLGDKLLFEWEFIIKGKFQRNVIFMLAYDILWRIWFARNKLVFQEEIID